MNCPVCKVPLQMTDRQGVEIDYCPQCRGVWLDRGELDKLIERSASQDVRPAAHDVRPSGQDVRPTGHDRDYRPQDSHHGDHYGHGHHKHKKESFLGDLFDF
jgi:uncharacterized protein